ncbi:MAG: helix-turn-helix domain-containing protein [Promethearchaeota archaeon]
MKEKNEKKKPVFEKIGLVFRSPVRVDILKQLSEREQKPIEIANKIGIPKQSLNYHLNVLKRGGLVKAHIKKLPEEKLTSDKGARVLGFDKNGKVQVSSGIELTENGKKIVEGVIQPIITFYNYNLKKYDEKEKDKNERG